MFLKYTKLHAEVDKKNVFLFLTSDAAASIFCDEATADGCREAEVKCAVEQSKDETQQGMADTCPIEDNVFVGVMLSV